MTDETPDQELPESENDNENVAQVETASGNLSITVCDSKVELPSEFFEYMGDSTDKKSGFYKCLFKGCKLKTKKDGTPKYLVVKNDSRCNGKRHFLAHDPNNELGLKEKWNSAVVKMTGKKKIAIVDRALTSQHILKQSDFDKYVLNYLIMDGIPIHEVENEGFKLLMSKAAPHLKIYGRTFYTMLLEKEFESRQQQLKQALLNCSDAATTIDAWTCSRRSYLGETVHWFDKTSVKRKSACLACRRIKGRHTHDVLAKLIESIHEEYQITDKLSGSTTDNGSNFIKCFREKGASSTLPNYEEEDNEDYFDASEDEEMVYFEIGEILNDHFGATPLTKENVTLPVHRRCASHLLSLVSKTDVRKIQDYLFQQLRSTVFEKLQKLWNKQNSSSLNSDIIMRHLGKLFVVRNDTRWNSEYYAVSCFVRILKKKNRALKKLFEELKLDFITPNEEQLLKEYVVVMKPICESLDILQADKHVGMGYLLPTITVLRKKLMSLTDVTSITLCKALVSSLLDAILFRFDQMFTDNELRLATITNPMFKLSWLEKDEDIERAKSLFTYEYNRIKGIPQEHSSSDESSDCSSSSLSGPSPKKQRKKNFFASITKKKKKSDVMMRSVTT